MYVQMAQLYGFAFEIIDLPLKDLVDYHSRNEVSINDFLQ